ncbi:response regulator [Neomegalonema perideroedes]|uniref:response regulator n=1 Tax=Neomegalonema perideroedes TaxID=217219 RepID=UPI0003692EC2|nr:response regulator transcription factor [Neomegalonema perideroedes]
MDTPISGEEIARRARIASVRDLLIVDDHPLICDALAFTLKRAFDLKRVRAVSSLAAAKESVAQDGPPDAVALDLNLPDAEGLEGVMSLRRLAEDAPLTVISSTLDPQLVEGVIGAGARGYVLKTLERKEMVAAFSRMWAGDVVLPEGCEAAVAGDEEAAALARDFATLTPQQFKILRLICEGRPNKLISYELSIAEATVKTHIAAIMSKIRVRNRTQVAFLANRARIFSR